ncbi:MAG TPA: antitoxin Xre-like helix-turn-helix domain-containing protein [Pricia sp.]|nr:antitoxin Xre-like helix-turn-helix domain-containing protein [Pricia sp.]
MKLSKAKIANGEFNAWDDESQTHAMIAMVRDGISYGDFLKFFRNEPFTDQEWANYLGISVRTLDRYRNGQKRFPAKQSERILEIKRLLTFGESVFEDRGNFMDWMCMRNIPMGGVLPKDLLDTTIGINMVQDQLGRIEHGILA